MLGQRARVARAPRELPIRDLAVWDAPVDLLLERAALVERVRHGGPPDPLAGLKIADEDVSRLLGELPGLERPDASAVAGIEAGLSRPVAEARLALAEALATDDRLGLLVRAAHLSAVEAEVLAVLCAVEADPRRQRLVAYINDDVTQRRLTLWSLGRVLGESEELVAAVMPGGRLRRAALLNPLTDAPWASLPVATAPAVMWCLYGGRYFDPDLPPGAEVVDTPGTGDAALAVTAGPDRRRRLEAALSAIDARVCVVAPLPTDEVQWDALIRQAALLSAGAVVEVEDVFPASARERIEAADHLAWAVTSAVPLPLPLFRRSWTEFPVAASAATDAEWKDAFPDEHRDGDLTSTAFRLSADQLGAAKRAAEATGGGLVEAVRRLAAGQVEATAMRVRPSRNWDDLVLDDDRLAQLREIAVRQRQRDTVFGTWGFSPYPSTGVTALFAGPSGTGKTLAAEIIAGELGVDLYKVDLANLVSKYIGDTEKNLARVFEAAEASSVVLFFDEADALFGKRSQVSDAHDRYANIEVAYLLQRLERYEGVAVLATNLASNIDQAFVRRLHVVIEFSLPEAKERRLIWRRCLPPSAPLGEDLDIDRLADEVEITGGTIRNVCTRAAFLAAESASEITMAVVVTALRRELEKIGRLASSSQWRDVFSDNS